MGGRFKRNPKVMQVISEKCLIDCPFRIHIINWGHWTRPLVFQKQFASDLMGLSSLTVTSPSSAKFLLFSGHPLPIQSDSVVWRECHLHLWREEGTNYSGSSLWAHCISCCHDWVRNRHEKHSRGLSVTSEWKCRTQQPLSPPLCKRMPGLSCPLEGRTWSCWGQPDWMEPVPWKTEPRNWKKPSTHDIDCTLNWTGTQNFSGIK
jgi:hypothetical protein